MTTTQQRLDDRYGRRSSASGRRVIILVAAIATVCVAVFGWWVVTDPNNGVRADGTSFEVRDEHQVTVTFQLTAPLGRDVACAIEALDEEYGVVGWRIVEYAAADTPIRAFTEVVPTLDTATTGLVNSCWVT